MADRLNGRIAIVTGAASGVGTATAARFVNGSEYRIANGRLGHPGQLITGVA
ncbi:hypothetical protein [Burkholderia sp. Bp8963]|uniref:hypothetical protein n=1 Tax=Burkholderia sp. Bp8963 TaxID=2184547 RepID=UPI001639509A|nr:hypothetical protein [Burkholderia sp. Bp8963]